MDRPSAGDGIPARKLLLALNARADLSRSAICRLARELEVWRHSPVADGQIARQLSIDLDTLSKAFNLRPQAAAIAKHQLSMAERWKARALTFLDEDYPASLRELELPPPVLFAAGTLVFGPEGKAAGKSALPDRAVAIVGSRKASAYGIEIATWLGKELARAGVTVVSGFARGVDAAAHRGALEVATGSTVAVLGCGLGVDYPRGQSALGHEISQRGALLSEFPCGSPPASRNFPIRNRIIANLSRVTVVVEAAPRSGSLVTARLALESGREVYAVPGRITDELALGTNELLRDGAGLVTHPADLLDALRQSGDESARGGAKKPPPPGLSAGEAAIYSALDAAASRAADELAQLCDFGVDEVLRALLDLELAGHVGRVPGGGYLRL